MSRQVDQKKLQSQDNSIQPRRSIDGVTRYSTNQLGDTPSEVPVKRRFRNNKPPKVQKPLYTPQPPMQQPRAIVPIAVPQQETPRKQRKQKKVKTKGFLRAFIQTLLAIIVIVGVALVIVVLYLRYYT